MTIAKKFFPRTLRWIVAAYFALATLYALITPAFEVSDEPLHVAFAQHLANGGALPVQRSGLSMEQAPWQQEGSQPPLYYALLAVLAQLFDRSDFALVHRFNAHARQGRADAFDNFNQMQHAPAPAPAAALPTGSVLAWTALRFVGIACGAVAVCAAWALAAILTPDKRAPALAASLVAFNPMFVHIMSSVNNDTLATALASCALLLGARQISAAPTLRRSLLLGLVLGCAALTKVSGLVLAAIIPSAVLLRVMTDQRRTTDNGRRMLAHAAAIVIPILVIAGWWYVRNALLYGDPTGTQRMAEVAGLRATAPSALQLLGEWEGFYMAYWGLFGAVNIALPTPIYDALEVLLALSSVGLVFIMRDAMLTRNNAQTQSFTDSNPLVTSFEIVALCTIVLAVTFIALLRWTSLTLASQGRLLFPIITTISALWALGLLRMLALLRATERVRRTIVAGLCALLATLTCAVPFFVIRPAFALPERLANDAAIPAGYTPTELYFDQQIRWIGYRVNTPNGRVGADRVLDVTLYMQALTALPDELTLFMRVLQKPATNPTATAFYKSIGGGGMYSMRVWRPGKVVVEHIRVRLPDDFSLRGEATPQLVQSALAIDVGFIDTHGHFLETSDGTGQLIGRPNYVVAAYSPTQISSNAPAISTPLARFERADLLATDVARAGDALQVTLRWHASADFTEDYTVFVHLYAGDTLVAQADGPAAAGDFTARWWRSGDEVVDVHRITLPADAPAGPWTIRLGLYKPQGDFARMPGVDAASAPLPDAAARIDVK